LPNLAELPEPPEFEVGGYEGVEQAYHVEVWVEKTTMNDVLLPLCQGFRANLVPGAGELSITAVLDFLARAQDARRPARILYVSDFDPAGLGMPISVARKIEFYQRMAGLDDLDIRLEPLLLTAEQVAAYDLPRVPVKDSDLRKAHFEAAHGGGQVELDALEALYPGRLAELVSTAIHAYFDESLLNRAREQRIELEGALFDWREEVLGDFAEEQAGLDEEYDRLTEEYTEIQARFADVAEQFQEDLEMCRDQFERVKRRGQRLHESVRERLAEVAAQVDGTEFPLPAPELPEELDSQLYVSSRGYIDQLQMYKAYRNGTTN